jgi:hypothetical protein
MDTLLWTQLRSYAATQLRSYAATQLRSYAATQLRSYAATQGGGIVNKSVFAGVKRDSLTLDQIKELHEGGKINKTIPSKFFKSFKNLSIKIKDINLTISANREKTLLGNVYQPLHITQNQVRVNPVIILIHKIKYHLNKIAKLFIYPSHSCPSLATQDGCYCYAGGR